ncbi:hypothetical protein [Corallococcus sp. CA047B]|uniref:hypothetical protein n=1 Tax=Corallococcus sp. CA047B TaxID=2316729 RepID=UPI0011C38052|nr:hypothetical protein [Corallococcus sp. CA047B]
MGYIKGHAEVAMLFEPEEEKFDDQFSMRAPASLNERAKAMKEAERLRSINSARVKAMLLGFGVYDCLSKHAEAVRALAASERLGPDEVAVRLLEEALAAREKKKR